MVRLNNHVRHETFLCPRCTQQKPEEAFTDDASGKTYKKCNDCRARDRSAYNHHIQQKIQAGFARRVNLPESTRAKILLYFGNSCAFCGGGDKIELGKLVHYKNANSSDEPWNIVPQCRSCSISRRGAPDWELWYVDARAYDRTRHIKIKAYHHQIPAAKAETLLAE